MDTAELLRSDQPFIADTSAWWRIAALPADLGALVQEAILDDRMWITPIVRAHLHDRLTGCSAIKSFIEYVVIAELHRPRDHDTGLIRRDGRSHACVYEQREQLAEMVYTRRRDTSVRKSRLHQLLQCLLRVETDEIVGHVGIVAELL